MDATRLLNPASCLSLLLVAASPSHAAPATLPDPLRPDLPAPSLPAPVSPSPAPTAAPLAPSAASRPPAQAEPPAQSLPRLQGILRTSQGVQVLIDGRLLAPRQASGPYRVLAVHEDAVEIQWEGRSVRLSLYPQASRPSQAQPPAPGDSPPARPGAAPGPGNSGTTITDKTATSIAARN